jgi:hypothetical protein
VGISVAFDDASDCRCHRGELVAGKVNCRHAAHAVVIIIIGADIMPLFGANADGRRRRLGA